VSPADGASIHVKRTILIRPEEIDLENTRPNGYSVGLVAETVSGSPLTGICPHPTARRRGRTVCSKSPTEHSRSDIGTSGCVLHRPELVTRWKHTGLFNVIPTHIGIPIFGLMRYQTGVTTLLAPGGFFPTLLTLEEVFTIKTPRL